MGPTWRMRSEGKTRMLTMPHRRMTPRRWIPLTAILATLAFGTPAIGSEPLRVCATVPELGSLATTIGGAEITITVFTRPTEDPHFTPARPSLIKAASRCALLLVNGLALEVGWLPVLLQGSRNAAIQPGRPGYLDVSAAVTPLLVPRTPFTRAMGDVHPAGNPHYLTDPLNGLLVAATIRDALVALRPNARTEIDSRLKKLRNEVHVALVGPELAAKYGSDVTKLARLHEQNALLSYLEAQGERALLAGWLGALTPYAGTAYVDDHRMWPYFARRFGLVHAGSLEPFNGVPPTTRHLQSTIEMMRARGVRLLLTANYYDPRHARFVAEKTGATIARMANQTGTVADASDYLSTCDYNVRQVVQALEGASAP